jgi:hypothetical protein
MFPVLSILVSRICETILDLKPVSRLTVPHCGENYYIRRDWDYHVGRDMARRSRRPPFPT